MRVLFLILVINFLGQNIFGAGGAGARRDSPPFISASCSDRRLPLGSLNKSFQLNQQELDVVEKIKLNVGLQESINILRTLHHDTEGEETKRKQEIISIHEQKDKIENIFYTLGSETRLQVMKYLLLNFDFLGAEIQYFKDFVDECFSLPRASMRDYLHFIQVKIDDRNVRVCNMDEFFAAPESFLTGEQQTIFLYKQPRSLSDPHYTAIVLYPKRYIEIIDSMRRTHHAYPSHLANDLYTEICKFNTHCKLSDKMMLVEHDVERQTTSGDCPYFAMFSALQARYHDTWYKRLSDGESHFIFPMDSYQLSATCSLTRLNFLQRLFEKLKSDHSSSKEQSVIDAQEAIRAPSPFSQNTVTFIRSYDNFIPIFTIQPDLRDVSLGCSSSQSSFNIARPFIRESPGGRVINGIIEALKLEFNWTRCSTYRSS
jgi:hypothetical protein